VTIQYHVLTSTSEVVENHLRSGPEIPSVDNVEMSLPWGTESKAFEKSKKMAATLEPCQGETAHHGWHR